LCEYNKKNQVLRFISKKNGGKDKQKIIER